MEKRGRSVEALKDFYSNKRVLITGHTGFKGSWISQILLNFRAEVCGIALRPKTEPNLFTLLNLDKRMNNHYVDIRDYDTIKKIFDQFEPEIVLHLAAQPLVIDSYKEPRYTYDVNIMGTVNICECVRLSDSVKSFVNITTDKVYENVEDENHYYREDEKLNGYDPYSNSKSCSELVTQSYIKSFFKIPVSTCRAGNVIGGGDFSANRIMVDSYFAASKERPIKVRNPNSVRPYQHVLEADMFYLMLAMKQYIDPSLAGHYNIGPNENDCITSGEIVKLFCQYWQGASYEFANVDGPHEANFLKLDSSKARNTLGWRPKWSVNEAVEKTVELYKTISRNDDIMSILNQQIDAYLG
ncbi:MAG: CDP-glucose 4,6-dehydratase [Erysipelotrichaceae bacterium]|nr:CDP-glucose 4,6-dehydratase [Erysipelotrichaceae bacterium]